MINNIELYLSENSIDGERWKKINTELYPDIKDVYWISSKARVFNEKTFRFLKTRALDPKKTVSPYFKVNLQVLINGRSYSQVFLVHRLMLSTFYPVPNMQNLFVNHKDGNKLNDELSNLEWTTNSENLTHAYRLGLYKPICGEEHCCATLKNKEVLEIIQLLLSRKFTHKEIADKMNTTVSIIDSIAQKKSWKSVSKDIDFSILKGRVSKKLSIDDIRGCCEYFATYQKTDNISVRRHCLNALLYINYPDINESILNAIRKIYNKERYTEISYKYDF